MQASSLPAVPLRRCSRHERRCDTAVEPALHGLDGDEVGADQDREDREEGGGSETRTEQQQGATD